MPTTKAKVTLERHCWWHHVDQIDECALMIMMISTMVWIKFNFQEKKQSDWRKDRVALETYIVFQKV